MEGARQFPFVSILFHGERADAGDPQPEKEPICFQDLNLGQVVAVLTSEKSRSDLAPHYYARLTDLDSILYRQEVMKDMEDSALLRQIGVFSNRLYAMRLHLGSLEKRENKYEKARIFLNAADIYCDAVAELWDGIRSSSLKSRGLLSFRDHLSAYIESAPFTLLRGDTERLKKVFSSLTYSLVLGDGSITVCRPEGEADYTPVIEETFKKFRQGAIKDHLAKLPRLDSVNHIQEQVLNRLALLYPDEFSALEGFHLAHQSYQEPKITRFDREVRFYVAYLEYLTPLRKAGLKFCYPEVSPTGKEVLAQDAFDLPLARKLVMEGAPVITNSYALCDPERILVVSGPNQGGKTTFARMFGQLHYLASLGCPVPGTRCKTFLFDQLFTHFEKEEDIQTLHGKLQDDLVRMRQTLDHATSRSLIVMNEIFSSTSLKDAIFLGRKILEKISELDLLAVCVTFVDELATYNEKTVSMVSQVNSKNPAIRTFKVERTKANGLAYALAIAEKNQVTYEWLKNRIHP